MTSRHLAHRRTRLALAVLAAALAGAASGCGVPTPSPSPGPSASATPSPSSVAVVATPAPSPSAAPPTPSPTTAPGSSPSPTVSPTPSPPSSFPPGYRATRVVVPALGIDLAITKSPPAGVYPYCNVAMTMGRPFGQPGQRKATFVFAHARDGMFGPIYELVMVKRTPSALVGLEVDVYTNDSMLHQYRIARVLPHQVSLARPLAARRDQLWLQTSEGPHGTPGKTLVMAEPVATTPASTADAHPAIRIVRCGY